jgi:hypothetical protein
MEWKPSPERGNRGERDEDEGGGRRKAEKNGSKGEKIDQLGYWCEAVKKRRGGNHENVPVYPLDCSSSYSSLSFLRKA